MCQAAAHALRIEPSGGVFEPPESGAWPVAAGDLDDRNGSGCGRRSEGSREQHPQQSKVEHG